MKWNIRASAPCCKSPVSREPTACCPPGGHHNPACTPRSTRMGRLRGLRLGAGHPADIRRGRSAIRRVRGPARGSRERCPSRRSSGLKVFQTILANGTGQRRISSDAAALTTLRERKDRYWQVSSFQPPDVFNQREHRGAGAAVFIGLPEVSGQKPRLCGISTIGCQKLLYRGLFARGNFQTEYHGSLQCISARDSARQFRRLVGAVRLTEHQQFCSRRALRNVAGKLAWVRQCAA